MFLNLAESLEKNQERLNHERVESFYAQENETLLNGLIREWRELIIRLFAEEYLDDFQYRQALVSGDLLPILATRKLLSPIKYPVAILNSISMVLCQTAYYLMKQIMQKVVGDFMQQFYDYQKKRLTIQGVAITLLEMVGIIGLISIPVYLATIPFFLVMSLPLITTLLEVIACPVNKLIRPLAAYTGIAAITLSIFLSAASVITAYALVNTLVFTSLMTPLYYLTQALSLYSLYELGRVIFNLYNINPALGIFQAVLMVGILLIPSPDIDTNVPINAISLFLLTLANCSGLYYINEFSENISAGMAKKYEVLPLPKEPVPEAIQRATLLGNKTASQSHRFFNTLRMQSILSQKNDPFGKKHIAFLEEA